MNVTYRSLDTVHCTQDVLSLMLMLTMLRPRRLRWNWGREDTRTSLTQALSSHPASPHDSEPVWPVYCVTGSIQTRSWKLFFLGLEVLITIYYLTYPVSCTFEMLHKEEPYAKLDESEETIIQISHILLILILSLMWPVSVWLLLLYPISALPGKYWMLPRDWSGCNPAEEGGSLCYKLDLHLEGG